MSSNVREPALERQGRRLGRPAARFFALAGLVAVAGAAMVVIGLDVGPHWLFLAGLAVLLLAGGAAVVGLALLFSSIVARWSARHRSFA